MAPSGAAFVRPVHAVRPPLWEDLVSSAQATFDAIERSLLTLANFAPANLVPTFEAASGVRIAELPRFPELEHRLSDRWAEGEREDVTFRTSLAAELAARPGAAELLARELAKPSMSFAEALAALARKVCGPEVRVRAGPIRSKSDRFGRCVEFPRIESAIGALEDLRSHLRIYADRRPAFAAVVALAAIGAAHPLIDGNGRTSRLAFNLLAEAALGSGYLPLSELGLLSRGGFLLAMRSAQYHGDWIALTTYIDAACEVTRKLHTAPEALLR